MNSRLLWIKNNLTKAGLLILLALLVACAPQKKVSTLAQLKYLQAVGRHEEAIIELTNYLASDPQSPYAPEAAYLIGESYFNLNRLDEAQKAYNRLTHEYPKNPYAALGWRRMAEIEQKKGNFKEAIEKYQHSMQIYSADFNIERCTYNIARLYEKDLKDIEAAIKEYTKLLKDLKNPHIAIDSFMTVAKIYINQNKFQEARGVLEKFLQLYPEVKEAEEAKQLLENIK